MADWLETFGNAFVPKKARPHLHRYMAKAGYKHSPIKLFGILFFVTVCITFFIFLFGLWPYLKEQAILTQLFGAFLGWAVIQLSLAAFFILVVYFYLDLRIFQRIQQMEQHFPDFLTLVSTNLKGGMGLEHSMFLATKKRFGALADEMTIVSKKVMTGHDLADALEEFAFMYDSPMIRRALNLIVGEIETGGKIAYIIDQVVTNLKRTNKLKAEMSASVITYVIFIGAIVVVIAPALFALSFHLLDFMGKFTAKLAESGASAGNLPFNFSEDGLDTQSFKSFSYAAVALVALFSSMIVSIIEKGSIKGGIKYIPIFLIGAMIVYFVFMAVLSMVFSGITI
ncbi:MAG: type II secretion system F family protein [Nanoarchaeota archaeon]